MIRTSKVVFGKSPHDVHGKLVAINGYNFYTHIELTGEHLDKVVESQKIQASTAIAANDVDGDSLSDSEIFEMFGSDPNELESRALITGDQPEYDYIDDSEWVNDPLIASATSNYGKAYTDWDWQAYSLPSFYVGNESTPSTYVSHISRQLSIVFNDPSGSAIGFKSWGFRWNNESYVPPECGTDGYRADLAVPGAASAMIQGSGVEGGFSGFQFLGCF